MIWQRILGISSSQKALQFLTGTFLFLLVSCAHMNSGHFVQMRPGDTLEKLSKEFGVSAEELAKANHQKQFRPGEWIFIPLKRGIIPQVWDSSRDQLASRAYLGESFLWPVPSSKTISSYYGPRGNRVHHGIDIPAPSGSYILAAADGKIIYSDKQLRGYGNLTIIAHDNGLFTIYAHAKKNFTKKGQKIYRGQVIAEVGNTGRSTGPHLHFEVRTREESLDPLDFLQQNLAARD